MLLWNIKENERLWGELDGTTSSLQLYEEYKKQCKAAKHKNQEKQNIIACQLKFELQKF